MHLYELTYLLSPELSEEKVGDFYQKINSAIQGQGGILERTEKPTKETLGYLLKKGSEYIGAAFLCSLSFYLEPQKLTELEEVLKKEDILRFSFFKKRVKKGLAETRKETRRKKKPRKVELKGIEEKIEEILRE